MDYNFTQNNHSLGIIQSNSYTCTKVNILLGWVTVLLEYTDLIYSLL